MRNKIERTNGGRFKRKYGIILKNIHPYYKSVLEDNPLAREDFKSDDKFVEILFYLKEKERVHKSKRKFFPNPYTNEITTYSKIETESNLLNWKCSICNKHIKSEIANFTVENFLCKKCKKYYINQNIIDKRIIENSFEFHKHCRTLLLKEQEFFLRYIRNFEIEYRKNNKPRYKL